MKRRMLVAAAIAAALGTGLGVGAATGQGTGGTVGESATGQLALTLDFRVRSRTQSGINPAVPRDRKRPKVADLLAGNGAVLIDGRRAGRHQGFDVTTFEGARRYRGGAEALGLSMVDLGNDDLLFTMCRSSDDERSNPCAVVGGTGRFAGARGFLRDTGPPQRTKEGFRVNTVVTFIP